MSVTSRARQRQRGGRFYGLTERGVSIARKAKQYFTATHGREPTDVKDWTAALDAQPEFAGLECAAVTAVVIEQLIGERKLVI